MRSAWLALVVLCVALISLDVADAGNSGYPGKRSKIQAGFPYHRVTYPDSVTTVANLYAANNIDPNSTAYLDTIFVARDWNTDGTIDSVGTGFDYIPVEMLVPTYYGIGPDTLWIKLLDHNGNTVGLNRWIAGAATTPRTVEFNPWVVEAERAVVFQGILTESASGYAFWKVESYHAR